MRNFHGHSICGLPQFLGKWDLGTTVNSAGSFQHIVLKTRGENLEPRAKKSLTILSAAKNKDVNAIQWRA